MSRNWDRQIQVVFDTRTCSLNEFDIEFTYSFDTTSEPNEMEVKIYNLLDNTINQYIEKDKTLIVNAGYKGDIGNIAKGYIVETSTEWQSVDKITTITGIDASNDYLYAKISKAYAPGVVASEIINDLVQQTGLAIGEFELQTDIQYPNGRSISGRIRDILKDIVVNDCQTNLQIKNGTIIIRNIEQGFETGFVLSADTGLIDSPESISDTDDDNDADYIVKSLLNFRIGAATRIRIDSKYLQADAVVLRGTHTGSKSGDFITEMEVKLV